MSVWIKRTREEKLALFQLLDDEYLDKVWMDTRDTYFPDTFDENFICRSCRFFYMGECIAPSSLGIKNYKDCEDMVTQNPLIWLVRAKDPFIEEGIQDFNDGVNREDCPYNEGTDGECGWLQGWDKANEHLALKGDKHDQKS